MQNKQTIALEEHRSAKRGDVNAKKHRPQLLTSPGLGEKNQAR